MFILLFAIIFGVGLTFFAIQNTNNVTIVAAGIPLENIPMWIVVIVSILIGLITASYFNVINIVSSAFKLHGRDTELKGADAEIKDLKNEIQRLKVENASLSSKKDPS